MKKKTLFVAALAVLGLALYLWPAIHAPVVLWSDSVIDLEWVRRGLGSFRESPRPEHPAKPAYLLFLRGATMLPVPGGPERAVVLAQSVLLWIAIGSTALVFGKRRGAAAGATLYLVLILFLRLRDSASAVMPEALSAALFLPIAAFVLWPPVRSSGFLLGGLGVATLFWVRPNLGAAALLLAGVGLAVARRWKGLLLVLAAFTALAVPVWLAARPREKGDPLGGLSYPLLEATADYYWRPTLEPWPRAESPEGQMQAQLRRAIANWKATLAQRGPDACREKVWHALHGLFGTEFYDASWSPLYQRATTLSRLLAPFLILAALAFLLCFPFRGGEIGINFTGAFLLLILVGQDLVLGPSPRYVLPALPALALLAAAAFRAWKEAAVARRLAAVLLFASLTAGLAAARYVLDWQWGLVESSGITLVQPIPRGALPRQGPATLHVRIAPPIATTSAQLEVFGPGSRRLYTSREDPARQRPFVTIPLPEWLLEADQRGAIELSLVSTGDYGRTDYLLFPVIPPPWSTRAHREGSSALSPATGILAGSLDWWAHAGPAD